MPIILYRRGEIWHYRGTVAGRRLRRSTGTADRRLAERIAAEAEVAVHRAHLDGPGAHLTMAQAAIAYREAGKSTRFLVKIEDHWKNTLVREITGEAIRQSCRKLYPLAGFATWNRQVIAPTMAIINYCSDLGWCAPIRTRRWPINPKKKIPADLTWVMAFSAQATKDGLVHLAALVLFLFGTGARIGEAVALTWRDVDVQRRSAEIRQTKTGFTRAAHLPGLVCAALENIPGNHDPDELVFGYAGRDSVTKVWANVIARAGIAKLSPHCCRHGFATRMLQRGYDVKTVAEAGGWKDATTVLRTYVHALDDKTVTDALFDTPATHGARRKRLSAGIIRGKTS